ncbi:Transposon Tf2-9 polyprotein [Dictyocoela muelleri]|nr:Transposon Tf2-9 polyprotein [Dictyocoela muelleri]
MTLHFPDPNNSFALETDASKNAIGAVLFQDYQIFGFYSYKLSPSEANYSITEKETFALLKSLYHFKPIILNIKIIARTDNKNLIPDKPLTSRIQRWKMLLQEFDVSIKHINGSKNFVADSLTRINSIIEQKTIDINWEEVKKYQNEDSKIKEKIATNDLFIGKKNSL